MAIQDTNLQSNRQHAVPQNIMDVEFKIIGDLTMRQFSYLMILGLLAYFNMQFMVGIFKWPLTLFFGLLGLGLAFVPVQDRGLDVWLVNFIKSVYSPTQRVWRKSLAVPSAFLYDNLAVVKQELITLAPTSSRRKLEEYLDYSNKVLPRDPLDMRVDEYVLKVRQAYAGYNTSPVSEVTDTTTVPGYDSYVPKPISEFISKEDIKSTGSESAPVQNSSQKSNSIASLGTGVGAGFSNLVSKIESNVGAAIKDISSLAKDVTSTISSDSVKNKEVSSIAKDTTKNAAKDIPISSIQKNSNVNISTLNSAPTIHIKEDIKSNLGNNKPDVVVQSLTPVSGNPSRPAISGRRLVSTPTSAPVFSSITPDRHSGRKFTSFLPEQGELVLPIRGERVLKTSDQLKLEENLEEKTVQLQQLLSQIRQSNGSYVDTDKTNASNAFSTDKGTVKLNSVANTSQYNKSTGNTLSNISSNAVSTKVSKEDVINITNSAKEQSSGLKSTVSTSFDSPVNVSTTINNNINANMSSATITNDLSTTKANAISEVSQEALSILVKKREDIMNNLSNLRSVSGANSNEKIMDLQKQLQQVNSQYQQVKKELQDIENITKAQGSISQLTSSTKLGSSSIALNTSSTFSKPNVLWGFVKDTNNKPVVDTVVIVKNFRGEPVRAIKTNALGQFNLTTPLNNGKYLVEVSNSNKLGLTFDTLSIEASGNVIPSMEFIGH